MKSTSICVWAVGPVLTALTAGCVGPLEEFSDTPPAPPRTAQGSNVKYLDLSAAPKAETQAATAVKAAEVNYRYRLEVLQGYCENVGDMTKLTWARREMKNLNNVRTFEWGGLADIEAPKGESFAKTDERLLVESLLGARKEYTDATAALLKYYDSTGDTFKAALVRNMRERLDLVRVYMYFLHAEVPGADLRPTAVIPAADKLFDEAMNLYKQGRIGPGVTNYRKVRRALTIFRQIIQNYPNSNNIAKSAFYVGEIYKEFFEEYVRAVAWYRRAWQWDESITLPARFQAATVYDFHLQNKAQAVECYRGTITYEQFNASNVRYSHQRVQELTAKGALEPPGGPSVPPVGTTQAPPVPKAP